LPLTGSDGNYVENHQYFSAWFILDYIESITSVITGDVLQKLSKSKTSRMLTDAQIKEAFDETREKFKSELYLKLSKQDNML
jgi:hypothetical protein